MLLTIVPAAGPGNLALYDKILYPFMWVIGWIMRGIHELLALAGVSSGAGVGWVLSIVGLTVFVRLLLVPLFVKQIKATRAMSLAQPEMSAIQKKYKGKRDQQSMIRMQEETRAVQRKYGASMSASCLPILFQMPVFFALYRLLYNMKPIADGVLPGHDSIGGMGQVQAQDLWHSTFFGQSLGLTMFGPGSIMSTKIVVGIMVAYLVLSMLFQTAFLTMKNMSQEQLNSDNPMVKSTKSMMYLMPLMYLFTGPVVQVGLLVYWVTSNTWMILQQFFIMRAFPTRGSAAAKWREAAHEKKFEAFREKEEAKLAAELERIELNEEGLNHKGVQVAIRQARLNHIHLLEKHRMELGLPEINLGTVDAVGNTAGQRMQPGQKGWEQYKAQFEADMAEERAETEAAREDVVGKDGLTAAQRAQKQAERRAAERQAKKKKQKQKNNKRNTSH